ncbi:PTS sugar transporter subunit IIB [Enterococcus sp. LJL99]
MTVRIMLACAGGFSTSMLVERMKEAAKSKGIDVTIDATAEGKLDKIIDHVDIVLLGPQVGHMEDSLKAKFVDKPVKISTITSIDYGMMNGEKVLNDALVS